MGKQDHALRNYEPSVERIIRDTLDLVEIPSVTGNTEQVAAHYEQLLKEVGCRVERYDLYPDNPTLVAFFGESSQKEKKKTLVFNGHMDVIPLPHGPAEQKDGRLYGRGTCDMKGSLAAIIEVLRTFKDNNVQPDGTIIVIANSLHESPGGRGEDLTELVSRHHWNADAVVVMEGATTECTIAQMGSATFLIQLQREGEPSHQLHTPAGTPHPITAIAEVIQALESKNKELADTFIEDIGVASYFVGRVDSGEFYNQMPNKAELEGVRRYGPEEQFEQVHQELADLLDTLAKKLNVTISLTMEKVRDGYRIYKNGEAAAALVEAIREVRGVEAPLVGKKLVTDAGIFAQGWKVPVLCHGPNQLTAHGDVEYVEIDELKKTAQVYLRFVDKFVGLRQGGRQQDAINK